MRLSLAVVLGLATAAGCAIVLGDYPLSGSVPWLAAVVIPLLIGAVMTVVSGGHRAALWMLAGPLALGAMAWGVRIATGWGLDPVPTSCWAAMALALAWPVAWGITAARRSGRRRRRAQWTASSATWAMSAGPRLVIHSSTY